MSRFFVRAKEATLHCYTQGRYLYIQMRSVQSCTSVHCVVEVLKTELPVPILSKLEHYTCGIIHHKFFRPTAGARGINRPYI